ncbi:hypothetical protein M1O20_03840 [Dehalococcoidia bacterium]|nr:hypothetical protein [Dehalococcoidia bacterium]
MFQETEIKKQVERELKTEIDVFQAAKFSAGILTSAHVASGLDLVSVASPTKLRVLNLEAYNAEPGWIQLEFRDGGLDGGRVLGPYTLNARSERRIGYHDLLGRHFLSGICVAFLSGYTTLPLSTGVKINVSYLREVLEPLA